MAYAALVSLAHTLDQILNHDLYHISPHEKKQILSVQKYVVLLQDFLEDFPDKAKNLEGRIRDEANDAEVKIENLLLARSRAHWAELDYNWEDLKEEIESIDEQVTMNMIKNYDEPRLHDSASSPNLAPTHTPALKRETGGGNSITKRAVKSKNSFRNRVSSVFRQLCSSPAATSSSELADTDEDVTICFDDDLMPLRSKLRRGSSQLQVIPIFGMAGIGKTTFARNAYDDPLIMNYFHIRAWVTVSRDYSAQEIFSSLLASMEGCNEKRSGQSNEEKVYNSLKGRRYLIVLDDMRSMKTWDEVRNVFPDDGVRSRIMLTTRLPDVAAYPELLRSTYEMRLMDEDQSWNLLWQKVFAHRYCPRKLESIGMEIARSCRGLPLAVVVIAGLLSMVSRDPDSWGKVAETLNSIHAEIGVHFEEISYLSHTHLPHRLGEDFLYMGFLPEVHEARFSKLIKLWETIIKKIRFKNHKFVRGNVTEKIESIAKQVERVMNTNNSFRIKDEQQLCDSPAGATSSSRLAPTHKDVMIGFDDDLVAIKSQIFGEFSKLLVIQIFGGEGIGKTALARNAYDDPFVVKYFHICAWVSMSQVYSVQEFCSSLLDSMEGYYEERSGRSNDEKVYKILKGRRYLIVMDDMWSKNTWDEVRNIFPDDGIGSRIILTTRLDNVAAYPNLFTYEMRLMDEDQSWNLLRQKVFAHQDCPPELENIGKEIARSCRGLPPAIVVIAGILSIVSKNPDSWGKVADTVNSIHAEIDVQFEERSDLRYTHLPHHLGDFFLSMGFLPEDHEVHFSKLIKLWETIIKKLRFVITHPYVAQLGYHILDWENVTEKIESIARQVERVMNTNNSFRIKDEQQVCDSPAAASSSSRLAPTHKDVMIGFDDDLMAIKSQLCGESSQLRVIPIYGMGGIGKTTLARNAYDDPFVVEYFHIRAWVTISQDYSVQEIFASLLVSMEGYNEERSGQSNEEKVYKTLKGRRYLIVMDDMWSTNTWDTVRNIFPDDGIGSRIILTTRLYDVAAYPNLCSPIYMMRFLDEDQSWNLLRQKVFAQQDCPPELENIGKEIARSCRGLPLAIVVIAGLLSTVSKNPASWGQIEKNVNSVVAAKDGQFEEILSLSYRHLPHHLRPCFLYMAGFPEDYEVRVSKLIRLWVAEGFLKRVDGSKSLEEEAEECLENLVKRSLVLVTKRKSNGKIKSCSLHDMMRNLCIRKASEEKFLSNIGSGNVGEEPLNHRRISCIGFPDRETYLLETYGSTIHTFMWFLYTSLPSLESFRLLRVLDAGDGCVWFLPPQLFELIHLRYLAINYALEIPAAISRLQNLQTLIILARGQWKLNAKREDCLPQEIWRMPQLRHLLFYGTLRDPEGTTSTLENLQTLFFSLSDYTTEGILGTIPNLKKLEIDCFYHVGRTYLNSLVCLHQLEDLELRTHEINASWGKKDFTFPSTLKKLTLSGLRLSWSDMTTVCSLPNLEVLKLKDYACRDSTWETTGEEFPKLEFLLIEKSYLEHWITEDSHFPRLKFLFLHECWRLSEIPDEIGQVPTLELIQVKGHVKKSLVESAKGIQEEQKSLGNDALQVRCMTH